LKKLVPIFSTSLIMFGGQVNEDDDSTGLIMASPRLDPGCRDLLGCVANNLKAKGHEKMDNLKIVPNNGLVVSPYPEYPASDHLSIISCNYKLSHRVRNYVLIVEDMQYEYEAYVKYCIPSVKLLIDQFRASKLPIVWTNWARRHDDGCYGAVDRYYGPQGIKSKTNPCYVFAEQGYETIKELAPINPSELSRSIVSLHLSKFADYDEEGREILFPMLEAWGVNTMVLVGAWTDDCIATTAFDAADKYGYDVILVNDACATATINGDKMFDVLYASTCCSMSAKEVVAHMKNHPELIEEPKAPLNGNVRFRPTNYRHDRVLDEVIQLRKRVAFLEEKLRASL